MGSEIRMCCRPKGKKTVGEDDDRINPREKRKDSRMKKNCRTTVRTKKMFPWREQEMEGGSEWRETWSENEESRWRSRWREQMKQRVRKKDLQSTFKKKSSEDEIPWAFLAEHQYLPLDDRLTLWRTRDWLEMMIPEEGSLNRDLPSKNQITSVTQGLALTTHSKYTSVPSRMLLPSILAPKIIFTWGGSVLLSKKEGEKNEVTKRVKMMRKSQSVSRWASTSATIYNKQWLPWITPWIANFFQGIRLVSKREKKMKNHWMASRHKGISGRRARCMCVGVNLHDGRKERTRERKRKKKKEE